MRAGSDIDGEAVAPNSYKREQSREPDEFYDVIEACSAGPRLGVFARGARPGWTAGGNQAEEYEIGVGHVHVHAQLAARGCGEWVEVAE